MRKVFFQTYGCQMNLYDSQKMQEQLVEHQYQPVGSPEEADLIIVNTCAIREKSEHKVFSVLGRFQGLKAQNSALRLGVSGCVAQQHGANIFRKAQQVDLVFGPDAAFTLPDMLQEVDSGKRVLRTQWKPATKGYIDNFAPQTNPLNFNNALRMSAHLAITKGCNNHCSFCVVPMTRGKEFSRTADNIMSEATCLVEQGVKEITVLGQNVNSYRAGNVNFVGLLERLSTLKGLERIRYTSSHPKDFQEALAKAHGRLPKLCEHLHLPVQSGATRILKAMRRNHTRENYLQKIALAKRHCPRIAISTDIIVGFPGESEEEFSQTLSLMQEVGFDHVYAFKYSVRNDTQAASLPDQISEEVKARRLDELLELHQHILTQRNTQLLGSVQQVLVERPHPARISAVVGRSRGHKSVMVVDCNAPAGSLLAVKIHALRKFSLVGSLN